MIGSIIQARMGSSRLPEKTMKILEGKPILQHIIERIQKSHLIDECVVATTTDLKDNVIEEFCTKNQIKCYRGSENDVLERFYQAANRYNYDIIVRITADDPLKDPHIIDKAIRILVDNDFEYVSNTIDPTYPEGLDVEVFTISVLNRAYFEANLQSEREHVTPYIWKNKDLFKVFNFKNESDLSSLRWTMDTNDDFMFMQAVYSNFKNKDMFYMEDILKLIEQNPDIIKMNSGHIRNEGYFKSLKED